MAIFLERGASEFTSGRWGVDFDRRSMKRPSIPGSIVCETEIHSRGDDYYVIPADFRTAVGELSPLIVDSSAYERLKTNSNKDVPDCFYTSTVYTLPYSKFGQTVHFATSPIVVNHGFFFLDKQFKVEVLPAKEAKNDQGNVIQRNSQTIDLISLHPDSSMTRSKELDSYIDIIPYITRRAGHEVSGIMSYFYTIYKSYGHRASDWLSHKIELEAEVEAMEYALADGKLERYLHFYEQKEKLGQISGVVQRHQEALADLRSRYQDSWWQAAYKKARRRNEDDFKTWRKNQKKTWKPAQRDNNIYSESPLNVEEVETLYITEPNARALTDGK